MGLMLTPLRAAQVSWYLGCKIMVSPSIDISELKGFEDSGAVLNFLSTFQMCLSPSSPS